MEKTILLLPPSHRSPWPVCWWRRWLFIGCTPRPRSPLLPSLEVLNGQPCICCSFLSLQRQSVMVLSPCMCGSLNVLWMDGRRNFQACYLCDNSPRKCETFCINSLTAILVDCFVVVVVVVVVWPSEQHCLANATAVNYCFVEVMSLWQQIGTENNNSAVLKGTVIVVRVDKCQQNTTTAKGNCNKYPTSTLNYYY